MRRCAGTRVSVARVSPEKPRAVAVAILLLAFLSCTSFAQGKDWPGFGGPTGNFRTSGQRLLTSWPDTGPKVMWKRAFPEGYSSISVVSRKLYTMGRDGEKEGVYCLDAATGKTIWQTAYASKAVGDFDHTFGDGPRSTPLVHEGSVFAIGVAGIMHCLDSETGEVRWRRDLWKDFEVEPQYYGYASSPVYHDGKIIVLLGGKKAGVAALDPKTGETIWASRPSVNSYSTPKVIRVGDDEHIVAFMDREVMGVDAKTGKELWSFEHVNEYTQNVAMPEWSPEQRVLFVSSVMAGTKGVRIEKHQGKYRARELWKTDKIKMFNATSFRVGDYVFGSSGAMSPAFLFGMNMTTGEINWRRRGFAKSTGLLAGGLWIILDETGKLAIASAAPGGVKVYAEANLLSEPSWTPPTLVGSALFIRDKKTMMALDLSTTEPTPKDDLHEQRH